MNKCYKALARLMELPSDFTYREAVAVLAHLGFREVKSGEIGGGESLHAAVATLMHARDTFGLAFEKM